jgi:hypothetical protein
MSPGMPLHSRVIANALIENMGGEIHNSGRITAKPEAATLSSLRYLRIGFASRLASAASRAGARLMAALRPAVLQNPKTGMR